MKIVSGILWSIVAIWDVFAFVWFYNRDNKSYGDMLLLVAITMIPTYLVLWLYSLWQKKAASTLEKEMGFDPPQRTSGSLLVVCGESIVMALIAAAIAGVVLWVFWEFKRPFMYSFFCFFVVAFSAQTDDILRPSKFINKDITKLPSFATWQKYCQGRRYSFIAALRDKV